MRSLSCYLQMIRPQHVLMGALASYLLAKLSGASASTSLLAALVMALDIVGASLYYFAKANKMYALKKSIYRAEPSICHRISRLGLGAMLLAILLSLLGLNLPCAHLTIFNALVVWGYKDIVSKWWGSKNLLMAMVCTSPVLLGWWAGENTHPQVPLATVVVFFAYLSREIIKDIQDIEVDRGLRKTLPLQYDLGTARIMAGTAMLIGWHHLVHLLTSWDSYYSLALLVLAWLFFGQVMLNLLFGVSIDEKKLSKHILFGNSCLMLAFACLLF